jgi:hypothetical protein
MARAWNTKLVSQIDCPGGGQVWWDQHTLYVSHMRPPDGTSIYDVADPKNPKLIAKLDVPMGWHSHKVRAANGLMVVNYEKFREGAPEFGGGLGIFDVSTPSKPKLVNKWRVSGEGGGVHRYDFDGRYAYISPTAEGYVGNIMMILDLAKPDAPEEVGRWWIPGQHVAGGEDYPWDDYVRPRCHHPLRVGDRLYVSYWHHGFYILDIADMSRPKLISGINLGADNPHPTHTALRMPGKLKGRDILLVADEDVAKLYPSPPAYARVYDISDETRPQQIATFQKPGLDPDGAAQPAMMGCHQPSERFHGTLIPFAWFANGLRLVDVADPLAPREVGYYEPDRPQGYEMVSSNDVTVDPNGLIYLLDRQRGLSIIESTVS